MYYQRPTRGAGLAQLLGGVLTGLAERHQNRLQEQNVQRQQERQQKAQEDREGRAERRAQQATQINLLEPFKAQYPEAARAITEAQLGIASGQGALGPESQAAVPPPADGVGPWRPRQYSLAELLKGKTVRQRDEEREDALSRRSAEQGMLSNLLSTHPRNRINAGAALDRIYGGTQGPLTSPLFPGLDLDPLNPANPAWGKTRDEIQAERKKPRKRGTRRTGAAVSASPLSGTVPAAESSTPTATVAAPPKYDLRTTPDAFPLPRPNLLPDAVQATSGGRPLDRGLYPATEGPDFSRKRNTDSGKVGALPNGPQQPQEARGGTQRTTPLVWTRGDENRLQAMIQAWETHYRQAAPGAVASQIKQYLLEEKRRER